MIQTIQARNGEKASDHLPRDIKYIYQGQIMKDIIITNNIHTIQIFIGLKGGSRKEEDGRKQKKTIKQEPNSTEDREEDKEGSEQQ